MSACGEAILGKGGCPHLILFFCQLLESTQPFLPRNLPLLKKGMRTPERWELALGVGAVGVGGYLLYRAVKVGPLSRAQCMAAASATHAFASKPPILTLKERRQCDVAT